MFDRTRGRMLRCGIETRRPSQSPPTTAAPGSVGAAYAILLVPLLLLAPGCPRSNVRQDRPSEFSEPARSEPLDADSLTDDELPVEETNRKAPRTDGKPSKQRESKVNADAPTEEEPALDKLRIGMTKQEVRKIYGEPTGRRKSPRGEIWTYGAQQWLRTIPYYGTFARPEFLSVTFGPNGRLTDYEYVQQGDAVSEHGGMVPHYGPMP